MRLRERVRCLWALLADDGSEEEEDFDLDALETATSSSDLAAGELRTISPGAGEVLIDERDTTTSPEELRRLEGRKTLVVVGAECLKGIAAHLESRPVSDMDLAPLDALSPEDHNAHRSVPLVPTLANVPDWWCGTSSTVPLRRDRIVHHLDGSERRPCGSGLRGGTRPPVAVLTAAAALRLLR